MRKREIHVPCPMAYGWFPISLKMYFYIHCAVLCFYKETLNISRFLKRGINDEKDDLEDIHEFLINDQLLYSTTYIEPVSY
jgi:hypothetical protein